MRRLRRPCGRQFGQVLHHAGGPGRRCQGRDRSRAWPRAASCTRCRRPSASITACSAASARPGMLMSAADLLQKHPEPERARGARVARGQHLPLHRLPQHRQGDPGRRCEHAGPSPGGRVRDRAWLRRASASRSSARRTSASSPARAATPTTSTSTGRPTPTSCAARTPMRGSRASTRPSAEGMPGVLAVLTGEDVKADGLGGLICGWMVKSKDGSPMKMGPHPLLALEQGALRRRPGGRGRGRDLPAGQGRRRGARGRLRRARRRGGRRRRPRCRRAGPRRGRQQPDLRLGARRQGGDRRRVRQGGPRHQDRPGQQPAGAQRDGAARRGRRTTTPAATASPATSPARTRTCTGW